MALVVQKFGGTSVGDVDRIRNVAAKVIGTKNKGNDVVVVVSAMSGATDYLINLGKQVTKNPSKREMDMLISTGEQVSIALLSMAIHDLGADAISYNAAQIGIKTTADFTKAKILDINTEKIMKSLREGKIVVAAGFQGIDEEGNITTLGRGGSDTTAVAIAAALKADRCDIYTDVDGVYTADPRIVKNAKKLPQITHDEMLELASMGAKVLHDRSVIFAMKYGVPLRVVSTFVENEGTMIVKENSTMNINMEDMVITGIAKKADETQVNISGIPDNPGVASEIFKKLAESNINVNMIVQSVGWDSKSDISFTVLSTDIDETKKIMDELKKKLGAEDVTYNQDIAIVSVVGIGMRSHAGVAASVFDELAKAEINIQMISTSEIKISVVIMKDRADDTVRLLHKRFFGD